MRTCRPPREQASSHSHLSPCAREQAHIASTNHVCNRAHMTNIHKRAAPVERGAHNEDACRPPREQSIISSTPVAPRKGTGSQNTHKHKSYVQPSTHDSIHTRAERTTKRLSPGAGAEPISSTPVAPRKGTGSHTRTHTSHLCKMHT